MILLLSILLGTLLEECHGLQAGIQYQYEYTGTTTTWIPPAPTYSSGSALRADVALQLTQNGDLLVKTSNIKVAERNGKAACSPHQHTEFPYREMDPQDATHLEKPFLVHINRSEVSYMEVPHEPVWVTNIRRGIINTIPLIPLAGQHFPRLTFGFKEDTVIGSCFNRYSMLKLSSHLAKLENKKQEDIIEVDVQRERVASFSAPAGKGRKTAAKGRKRPSKTHPQFPAAAYTVAPIQDTLSILTRTLDDQQCKDNHFTMKVNGNQESVERTQRSSEGTFLMRGEGTVLRLERAEVMGDIMIYTGEYDDEYIRITSKQVLQLRAVTQVEETFPITYPSERRTLSFSIAEGPRSTIEEKLLGISPTDQQVEENMAGIVEELLAINNMQGGETPQFLKTFQRLVERMTILSWTQIEDLITRVANTERDRQIIYQAFLASGRNEVLTHIVEKMKNRTFRASHSLLAFQIFEAPTTPVRNPALIPAMLEVVSGMGEDEEVAKASSLLNIAKLANRYCLDSQTGNTCDPGCDTDFILTTFLPMLSRGLQNPLKWKKLLNVQAVCALGSPYSIPSLQPIIQGTNNEDIDLRISAIYCLTDDLLPKTAQETVFDSLMPLMNNPSEFPEVRSIAFLVLTTWEPSLSWWEHVAISTWKENSTQLVSFISSTLTSLSKGGDPRSKNAKKVVHLAKHPQNSERISFARSTYLYLHEVVKNCQVGTNVKLAWLSSTESTFPRSVYYQLQFVTVMGMTLREKGAYFTNIAQTLYQRYHPAILLAKQNEDWRIFREIYKELMEELELPTSDTSNTELFDFLLISEPLPHMLYSGNSPFILIGNTISLLWKTAQENIPVHFRLTDSTLVFPSDLGLPILIKHEEDFAFTVSANFTQESGPKNINIRLSLNLNHRNALKTKTLVPWSNGFAVGVVFEAGMDVTLPLMMILWQEDALTSKVVLRLLTEEKVQIMSLSSDMYTCLMPLHHIEANLTPEEPGEVPLKSRSHLEELGIHLQSELRGTMGYPKDGNFNFINILKSISSMQVKYDCFEYRLVLDPESSRTKSVTFVFHVDIKEREQNFNQQVSDEFGQESQGPDYYELFSQVSQTSSSGFEDFDQQPSVVGFEQETQHSQTFGSHLERIKAIMMPHTGGKMYTIAMTMEPENSLRKYEVAINMVSTRGNIGEEIATKIQKIHFTFLSSPVPGIIDETYLTCLDLRMETPFLLPLMTKEILLETNLSSKFLINLYSGDNCEGPPGLKLEGTFDVSSAAIQSTQSMEERDNCDLDFSRKIYPFYDQAHLAITRTQYFRNLPTFIKIVAVNPMPLAPLFTTKNADPRLDNKLTAEAVLNKEKGYWHVTVAGAGETSVYHVAGSPLSVPFSSLDAFTNFEKLCHLTYQSVKTYDGLLHPFEPSSCWTTATIFSFPRDDTRFSSYLEVAVQVRFTDLWEVRLIRPASALILDVTRSDILVNEEPFSGHSEKFVIHRLQDSQMIGIGMVAVRVGDTVDIMVSDLYYGEVVGVCGNYDGEPINDMMGPTGCLYTDPALHTLAWHTPGVGCSRFTLRNKKRTLAEYRESCDKVVFQPTGLSQQNAMENCTEWKYDERTTPTGLYCKSRIPTPACRPGCHQAYIANKDLGYSCRMSSSLGQNEVQYGENAQCFNTVSPSAYFSGCFHL